MSESEYVDRTPLDDPAWVIALVEERAALRARVAELEGAVRKVVQVADNTARAFPDEVQEKDEYRRGQVRGAMDAARPARALLPAPAPGRDTDGGKDA